MRAQLGAPIAPASTTSLTVRIGVWNRKFSWTARNTPASSAASTIATQSVHVGAKGFWTTVATPCRNASSASRRCVSIRVTMSTNPRFSARNIVSASVYQAATPNAAAAVLAFAGSVSHTATRSAPAGARSFQEWRWLRAKNPHPIRPTRTRSFILFPSGKLHTDCPPQYSTLETWPHPDRRPELGFAPPARKDCRALVRETRRAGHRRRRLYRLPRGGGAVAKWLHAGRL